MSDSEILDLRNDIANRSTPEESDGKFVAEREFLQGGRSAEALEASVLFVLSS